MIGPFIQSYITTRTGESFMVSTIERDCSSPYYPHRYNETLAWNYNRETAERGEQIFSGECDKDNLWTHNNVCKSLYETGELPKD